MHTHTYSDRFPGSRNQVHANLGPVHAWFNKHIGSQYFANLIIGTPLKINITVVITISTKPVYYIYGFNLAVNGKPSSDNLKSILTIKILEGENFYSSPNSWADISESTFSSKTFVIYKRLRSS